MSSNKLQPKSMMPASKFDNQTVKSLNFDNVSQISNSVKQKTVAGKQANNILNTTSTNPKTLPSQPISASHPASSKFSQNQGDMKRGTSPVLQNHTQNIQEATITNPSPYDHYLKQESQ